MEKVEKNDFIELEFTGKIKETGEIFDTNSKQEIEKFKLNFEPKQYIICVSKLMTLPGLDKDLLEKEVGKDYVSEFKAEEAFGKRNPSMIRMIPIKYFLEQRISPQRGMQLSIEGMVVRIVSVSGGRVLVDFNNPLAGRTVVYNYKIIRKVIDEKEKVNALQDFFFKKRFDFDIKDKEITFKVEKNLMKYVELMSKSFEEIIGLKLIVSEASPKKEEKAEDKSQ